MPPVVSMSIIANRGWVKIFGLLLFILIFSIPKISAFVDSPQPPKKIILSGAEQIDQYIDLIKQKRVGLVVNQSSVIGKTHLVDSLLTLGVDVRLVFTPEHGYKGQAEAGQPVEDSITNNNIQLCSLYGKKTKPDSLDMAQIDIILFDIQDVGVRFFTYISTLNNIMEACATFNIPMVLLDRPNPNAHYIDGPVLDTNFRSFVGKHQIPIVYGMTIGELALMIKGECWMQNSEFLKLKVITCKNYTHRSKVKLKIKPSPNLPNDISILLYPSLCLFEGTVVSLGRGTDFPFQIYGHPKLKKHNQYKFVPQDCKEAMNPPCEGELCYGKKLNNGNYNDFYNSKKINLKYLIKAYKELKMDSSFFLPNLFFDRLAGSNQLRFQIIAGDSESKIRQSWKDPLQNFKMIRKKYLIYHD